jgi:hypothetical protein
LCKHAFTAEVLEVAVFNVALALAFVISNFAAPGGRLVSFVFQQEALHTLPPYQQVLLFVFANYWLPALVIYLLLTTVQANRYVVPSRVVHIVLGIANSVLVLYFIIANDYVYRARWRLDFRLEQRCCVSC